MARVEIDETELLAKNNLATLHQTLLNNPAARKLLHQAVKTVRPDAVIPEIDARAEVMGEVDGVKAELAAIRKERDDEKAERDAAAKTSEFQSKWERQKTDLRNAGWQDEGIAAVEALAQKEGIPNLKAAAALFEKENPPSAPVQPSGFGTWDFFAAQEQGGDEMKKLLETRGDDPMTLSNMVNKALADTRQGGGRR